MGTISDKLMRIINTKEDIRQALISKGYDVPTSIPFKEYAKMISDLPCRVDSFPDIEGIVARYSALGLTNEQMAENPVWKDLTDNGHDLQMKNLARKGMSGVGGYVGDFSKWVNNRDTTEIGITKSNSKVIIDVKVSQGSEKNIVFISKSNLGISNNVTIKITSTYPEGVMKFANSASNKYLKLPSNGIITLQDNPEYTSNEMHLHLASADLGQITIEQLPLYPGALVFDGVDDYGVCENFPILTKEKGYTVVVLRQWDQDFLNTTLTGGLLSTRNYSTGEGVAFEKIESSNKGYWNLGAGGIIDFAKSPFTWQTSKQYNNVGILKGDKNHGKPLCVGCGLSGGQQCGRFAIWELVFLDHDATEEELTKIKDYFVKTYPWLFPDQAWTVVGKTNEDEDRATIANITGNGNNLVLSNFGFIEGSGYNEEGEHAGYLVTDGVDDRVQDSSFKLNKDWTLVGEWVFLNQKATNAGITKPFSFVVYNRTTGLSLFINTGTSGITIENVKSIKAICSDGRIYLDDWSEMLISKDQDITSSISVLSIGFNGTAYTQMAFKNLGIYNNQILSKDDCIKAYNYLQTLKSK